MGFELNRVKSFDDDVVTYTEPLCYGRGDKIGADYFQVKFHVSQAGANGDDAPKAGTPAHCLSRQSADGKDKYP